MSAPSTCALTLRHCTSPLRDTILARWDKLPPGPYGWNRTEGRLRLHPGTRVGAPRAEHLLTVDYPYPSAAVQEALQHARDDVHALLNMLPAVARCAQSAAYRCGVANGLRPAPK